MRLTCVCTHICAPWQSCMQLVHCSMCWYRGCNLFAMIVCCVHFLSGCSHTCPIMCLLRFACSMFVSSERCARARQNLCPYHHTHTHLRLQRLPVFRKVLLARSASPFPSTDPTLPTYPTSSTWESETVLQMSSASGYLGSAMGASPCAYCATHCSYVTSATNESKITGCGHV